MGEKHLAKLPTAIYGLVLLMAAISVRARSRSPTGISIHAKGSHQRDAYVYRSAHQSDGKRNVER